MVEELYKVIVVDGDKEGGILTNNSVGGIIDDMQEIEVSMQEVQLRVFDGTEYRKATIAEMDMFSVIYYMIAD